MLESQVDILTCVILTIIVDISRLVQVHVPISNGACKATDGEQPIVRKLVVAERFQRAHGILNVWKMVTLYIRWIVLLQIQMLLSVLDRWTRWIFQWRHLSIVQKILSRSNQNT